MNFIKFKPTANKDVLRVYNHKEDYLGIIEFFSKWRIHKQFIFIPEGNSFFTEGCLMEIAEKMKELNKKKGAVR